jgi:outer membrane receptor protein involved in Fe transport
MYKHIFILFLLIFCQLSFSLAQAPKNMTPKIGELNGIIVDSLTNKGIDYASVRLFYAKDSTVAGGIYTDEKGKFRLDEIALGKYYIKITFAGYKTKIISPIVLTQEKPIKDIGVTKLQFDKINELEEIKVVATKELMTLALDKKVYNVDEDLSTRGGNVNDVLNNIPSIEVDQDGKISLRGDGNVTILIDGRPSTLSGSNGKSLLDAIPANSIERIEVVTNPSAKYDPDGTSGIINIVLKKNKLKGINGNVALNGGSGNVYNASAGLSLRNSKMNLYGTYAFRYYEGFRNYENDLKRTFGDSLFNLVQNRAGTDLMMNHTARIGADFYLKDRHTLGFGLTGNTGERERTGDLSNIQLNGNQVEQRTWNRLSSDPSNNQNLDINLNYKFDFKEDKGSLIFDMNQSFGNEYNEGFYEENYLLDYGLPSTQYDIFQHLNGTEKNWVNTSQVDYTKLLKNSNRIEAGAKSILRNSWVNSYSESRNELSNQFFEDTLANFEYEYIERIYSVYGNYAQSYKKFKFQGGLRAEQALQAPNLISDSLSFSNKNINIFPSAFVRYELNKTAELNLSYSRRINRPSPENLNPFTSYADPFNLRRGNPALRPEFINSFDVGLSKNYKKLNLTASVFYRQTNSVISRVKEFYEDGTTAVTYGNIDESHSIGTELVFIYRPTTWFRNIISGNANRIEFIDDTPGFNWNNSGINWSIKYAGTVEFWKKTASVQLNARYNAPITTAQGIVQPRASIDISGEKSLKDRKWAVGFRISDIMNTQEFRLRVEQPNTIQVSRFKQETRRFYINVSYKFGKYDIGKKGRISPDGGGGMDF